jgi:PAS domain S-box-containing protein
VGVLCLANRGKHTTLQEEQLLHAIASHASVALENARLFTRMDKANRHRMEIFDASRDFIVVHDEAHNVLRVNRSLSEFIGVSPSELIGYEHAFLARADDHGDVALLSVFCRSSTEGQTSMSTRCWSACTWFHLANSRGQRRAPAHDSCAEGHH